MRSYSYPVGGVKLMDGAALAWLLDAGVGVRCFVW